MKNRTRQWHPEAEREPFRWSFAWLAGPSSIAALLGILILLSLDQIGGRRADRVSPSRDAVAVPARSVPAESWPTVEEDLETLRAQPDLRAVGAASRLWSRGHREAVLELLERRQLPAGLQGQLLALAVGDPSDRVRRVADRILRDGPPSDEVRALCKAILESDS